MSRSRCDHQWVLAAGPWPVFQTVWERKGRGNFAVVDTHCRWCHLYSEREIKTRGEWTPRRTNKAMKEATIFWK